MNQSQRHIEPPGLDLSRLRFYLDAHYPGLVNGELTARLIVGGRSNLTYDVTDGGAHWVVRRPPLAHVLATAHDMSREYRVMNALKPSRVPVPSTVVLCEDVQILGAPFYVMAKVRGVAYRRADELIRLGAPDRARAISERMVDTLADLHEVDPNAVGLHDFGRPAGFLERQVGRWRKQLDASRSRELPGIDELHARLAGGVPNQSPPAIVHGDYRLDNLLIDENDEITAVLDWEMATLGDPITDLALLVAYGRLSALEGAEAVADAARAPGFLTPDQTLQRYSARSGRNIGSIGFYLALAYFKLAVILEGIHFRFTQGKTVGAEFDRIGAVVEPLVAAGLAAFKEI
ncbi:phosphotransferase family protein [Mycobacterium colombiense]|uniref:phosphotransferase family protein n=1 Tax=Mycobacterium colombiense TaxID=339268 RepID=UPI00200B964C|nr:phosphotransferase family protein [Mycobacterium colombiense]MCK8642339.1 phosphotransferase family protein [Mycobacterium colombiense]